MSKVNHEHLADSALRRTLEGFEDLIIKYTATVPKNLPFLQHAFIREEGTSDPSGEYVAVLEVIRRSLGVSLEGNIRSKVVDSKIQDLSPELWIRGVINSLFCEFVFDSHSVFDDATVLQSCLIDSMSRAIYNTETC
jgi:hypothetical protein